MGKRKPCTLRLDRLKYLLDYNPQTGLFHWENPTSARVRCGAIAGHIGAENYRTIGIDGRRYPASNLAIFYMTGVYPDTLVDHIDRRHWNDKFSNLRCATFQENAFNSGAHSDNHLGLKGVHRHHDGRYRAQISVAGKRVHIGVFPTPALAHAAYLKRAEELHGAFFNGGDNR
jgi:hypothetical protein